MGYVFKTNIANRGNYGDKRNTSNIKYIVVHYTGNDGDHDESNANYFKNRIIKASAHYFVDDDSVTQSVPDNYAAWAVGGSKYPSCSRTGGGSMHGVCTNSNSISVELCDTIRNGQIYPTNRTIENAIALVKTLMKKYNVPASRVIRHFDVTGKECPAYWCGTSAKNALWKTAFHNKLTGSTASSGSASVASTMKWAVTVTQLRIRKGPGTNYAWTGRYTGKGVFTIVEQKNGWGRLKSGAGWISLSTAYGHKA